MFVSFGRRLRGLSGMRVGFRMKGSTGCLLVGIYGFMNFFIYLLWYTMLGVFWLIYGLCYLCYLLIKGLVKLCKKKSQEKKIAEAASKYTAPSQPGNETQNDAD